MAELIIHGVPLGHQVSKCDKKLHDFLGLFYDGSKGTKHNVSRRNNDVIYSYLLYENPNAKFSDFNGRTGSYFGMSLVLHGTYAQNSSDVFRLLKATYDNFVKNKVIQEFPNGSRRWMYNQIDTPNDKIATYISKGMAQILKEHPELTPKTLALPPITNQSQRY